MPQNTTERRYDTPSKCANLAELHGYRGGHGDIYLNAIYAHARPLEARVLELEEELRRMRAAIKITIADVAFTELSGLARGVLFDSILPTHPQEAPNT